MKSKNQNVQKRCKDTNLFGLHYIHIHKLNNFNFKYVFSYFCNKNKKKHITFVPIKEFKTI